MKLIAKEWLQALIMAVSLAAVAWSIGESTASYNAIPFVHSGK